MPIAYDGQVYEDEYNLEQQRPLEPRTDDKTQGATQVPSSENNAPVSPLGASRGTLKDLLPKVDTGYADFSEEGKRYVIMPYENFRKYDNIDDRRDELEEAGPISPNDPRGGWFARDNMETINNQSLMSAQLGGNDIDLASVQTWNDSRFPNYESIKKDRREALAEINKKSEEDFNKISDDDIEKLIKRLANNEKSEGYKKLEKLEEEYIKLKTLK